MRTYALNLSTAKINGNWLASIHYATAVRLNALR